MANIKSCQLWLCGGTTQVYSTAAQSINKAARCMESPGKTWQNTTLWDHFRSFDKPTDRTRVTTTIIIRGLNTDTVPICCSALIRIIRFNLFRQRLPIHDSFLKIPCFHDSVVLKVFHVKVPQNDIYTVYILAADPHLKICCSRDLPPQKKIFELKKKHSLCNKQYIFKI